LRESGVARIVLIVARRWREASDRLASRGAWAAEVAVAEDDEATIDDRGSDETRWAIAVK